MSKPIKVGSTVTPKPDYDNIMNMTPGKVVQFFVDGGAVFFVVKFEHNSEPGVRMFRVYPEKGLEVIRD